jgi:hypothetical protein
MSCNKFHCLVCDVLWEKATALQSIDAATSSAVKRTGWLERLRAAIIPKRRESRRAIPLRQDQNRRASKSASQIHGEFLADKSP